MLHALVNAPCERTVTLFQTVLHKIAKQHFEFLRLTFRDFELVQVGWENPVKNHATDSIGEELDVGRTDRGPITLAQQVHDGVTNKCSSNVHVLGHFHR